MTSFSCVNNGKGHFKQRGSFAQMPWGGNETDALEKQEKESFVGWSSE